MTVASVLPRRPLVSPWWHRAEATATETFTANVVELEPVVAAAKLDAQAQLMPQFGEYVKRAAPRVIPAFSITRA